MRDELELWGVDPKRLCVEGDGVALSRFSSLPLQAKAKSLHHLPEDPVIVGYAGSLVTRDTIQKGVGELVDAIAELRKQKMQVFAWIIGGPPAWVRVYEERAKQNQLSASDIRFEGRIAASEIPTALIACDVLVYPAPASNDPYFVRDTSPLKLFEYMASGVPIVCADLPPIRDIVDETCVKFCKPGDAASLAQGIRIAIQHPETAQERAKEAKRRAEYHSWKERMRRILERLEK
jgi:glycosyltransferase involved in cell wall biosynthesis